MKHITYVGTHEAVCESERDITHALIGQIDIEKERPKEIMSKKTAFDQRQKDAKPLTAEEAHTLNTFNRRSSLGYYALKVLDWCESEAESESRKEDWKDRINLRVITVDTHLT